MLSECVHCSFDGIQLLHSNLGAPGAPNAVISEMALGGKPYWADACTYVGIVEGENGLRFGNNADGSG